jgi:hypothetical protein
MSDDWLSICQLSATVNSCIRQVQTDLQTGQCSEHFLRHLTTLNLTYNSKLSNPVWGRGQLFVEFVSKLLNLLTNSNRSKVLTDENITSAIRQTITSELPDFQSLEFAVQTQLVSSDLNLNKILCFSDRNRRHRMMQHSWRLVTVDQCQQVFRESVQRSPSVP